MVTSSTYLLVPNKKFHFLKYRIGLFFFFEGIKFRGFAENMYLQIKISRIANLAGPLTIPTMQFAVFIFEDGYKILEKKDLNGI